MLWISPLVTIWLRTNSRPFLLALAPVGLVALAALSVLTAWPEPSDALRWLGAAMLASSLLLVALLVWQSRQPRLAYHDGHLLVWLRGGAPIRVPIEAVECFWLGQAPTLLPGKKNEHSETSAIVVRIADSAAEWRHQEVSPRLGKWCEGYITIRGTWCEPLSVDLVQSLNERLAAVHKHPTTPGGKTCD